MALDLAPYGIRVNRVSPGWIWTREVLKAADMDGGYLSMGPEGLGRDAVFAGSE